jgi:hypothetical protein
MRILHLSQALVNNGKTTKYLDEQLSSNTGNHINVLNVIHSIESGNKHNFMKKAGKLKMFSPLNVYHHHVDWNLLSNTNFALNNNSILAPQWKELLNSIVSGTIQSPAEAVEKSDVLITKAIGLGVTHKTGQWLIYIRHEDVNYFIGVFDHANDILTQMEQKLEMQHIGNSINIILTDADNDNKPLAPELQKQARLHLKHANEKELKEKVISLIKEEFPVLLINVSGFEEDK